MNQDLKQDAGKLRYDLVSPEIEKALAEVYTFGLRDHKENSWESVELNRYFAAEKRHDYEYKKNHLSVDVDSGLLHIKHKLWNVVTELLLALKESQELIQDIKPSCTNCKFNPTRYRRICDECEGYKYFATKQ